MSDIIKNSIVKEMRKSAEKKGLVFEFIYDSFFWVSDGSQTILFSETTPQTTSGPIQSITNNKYATSQLLRRGGFPTLPSMILTGTNDALQFIDTHGLSVLKPLYGIHGKGVSVRVSADSDVENLIRYASSHSTRSSKKVLIEAFFSGTEYRIFVIGKEKVFLTKKEPAYIITNGTNTVLEQINTLTSLPGHRVPITIDDRVLSELSRQGYSIEDTPAVGQKIFLSQVANLKNGGISTAQKQPIPNTFSKIGCEIASFMNMDVLGIDVLVDDSSGKLYILEINHDPGIQLHMGPTYGPRYNVCDEIIDFFFSDIR